MESLFDKPYFVARLVLYDIDTLVPVIPYTFSLPLTNAALSPVLRRLVRVPRSRRILGRQVSTACESQRWLVCDAARGGIGGETL